MKRLDNLISTIEAAERLGVQPKTVTAFLRSGIIQGIKLGDIRRGMWLIEESELVRFSAIRRKRGRPRLTDSSQKKVKNSS